jgi:hypothetical protein
MVAHLPHPLDLLKRYGVNNLEDDSNTPLWTSCQHDSKTTINMCHANKAALQNWFRGYFILFRFHFLLQEVVSVKK